MTDHDRHPDDGRSRVRRRPTAPSPHPRRRQDVPETSDNVRYVHLECENLQGNTIVGVARTPQAKFQITDIIR